MHGAVDSNVLVLLGSREVGCFREWLHYTLQDKDTLQATMSVQVQRMNSTGRFLNPLHDLPGMKQASYVVHNCLKDAEHSRLGEVQQHDSN